MVHSFGTNYQKEVVILSYSKPPMKFEQGILLPLELIICRAAMLFTTEPGMLFTPKPQLSANKG